MLLFGFAPKLPGIIWNINFYKKYTKRPLQNFKFIVSDF